MGNSDEVVKAIQTDEARAKVLGDGAIAQGEGAVAVGAGGIYVGAVYLPDSSGVQPPLAPPFQAPPPAADQIRRPNELAQLKRLLLDPAGNLRPITVGLHGFGGTGKTTLARLLCAEDDVVQACRHGILWLTVGKNPPEPRHQIVDLVTAVLGVCRGCETLSGASARLREALAGRQILLVIDDVWDEAQIRAIVDVSAGSSRLITTRNATTLPIDAELLDIGTMQEDDATRLLGVGLPAGNEIGLAALARRLGRWPVLLRLANRVLRQRIVRQKTAPAAAIDAVERALATKGVTAFDPASSPLERDQAVAATVNASLELLEPAERQRYSELSIFPQDVPIPLRRASELWRLTGALLPDHSEALLAGRLEPLSLLDYDGQDRTIVLHEVLRSFVSAGLPNKPELHTQLADGWGSQPDQDDDYAWRWLAFHRCQAALSSPQPQRHLFAEQLVTLVADRNWQQAHQAALRDPPLLREALNASLEAAVADDDPFGVPLIVQAADALLAFGREYLRPELVFELAKQGDLGGAKRAASLFSIDPHWHQAMLLMIAWVAPAGRAEDARKLCDEISVEIGSVPALQDLVRWIRADLWGELPPVFELPAINGIADDALIEQLLKRVGGGVYDRELILSRGLDPDARDPDAPMPTRGIFRARTSADEVTTRYLVELDGPYLIAYAAAQPTRGTDALKQYISVYTNYNYAEYRFSTLWLLLGMVVRLPRADLAYWVKDAVVRVIGAALSGSSVEFDRGISVAATAWRAATGDEMAQTALKNQAHQLIASAALLKPGRDRDGSDIWGHQKRLMLAVAQALGWLVGESALADQVLQEAEGLADSGFAGYQAPACWALAEGIRVCWRGDPAHAGAIDNALALAQRAAHNVQDPTFCARMTARVNAMRRHWWPSFGIDERTRDLDQTSRLPAFAALHRVGHQYDGRRQDALQLPAWAADDTDFDGLARLYQRTEPDFVRLNGSDRSFGAGSEIAVPDPGFVPHLAARIAAEVLAQAGKQPLAADRLQLLRSLVPYAMPSRTALDAVLTRLALAQARAHVPSSSGAARALETVVARRPIEDTNGPTNELLVG